MTNIDDNIKCVGDYVSAVQLSAGCSLGMWATLGHTGIANYFARTNKYLHSQCFNNIEGKLC